MIELIKKLLKNPKDKPKYKPKYKIREGIAGVWHYHLSTGGKKGVLCGNELTWPTELPLDSWGFVSPHIGETYCEECEQLARKQWDDRLFNGEIK